MRTVVSYPTEINLKAIEMRLKGVSVKEIMEELNILNNSQVKTWMTWYKNGENHRFYQPVGNNIFLWKKQLISLTKQKS